MFPSYACKLTITYYYDKEILEKVAGRRFIDQFTADLEAQLGLTPEQVHNGATETLFIPR